MIEKDKLADEQYYGIDLIKFICAYLVCTIHISPLQGIDFRYAWHINYLLSNGVCRIAVPFFFCCSGFLLFHKMKLPHVDKQRVKNYYVKIMRLLGLWTVLLFMGSTDQLWYLGGLIISTVILSWFYLKQISFKIITLIAIALYGFGILADSYSGFAIMICQKANLDTVSSFVGFINTNITRTVRLGLFSALLFFAMGAFFASHSKQIKVKSAIFGFMISIILLIIETFTIKHFSDPLDHNMYFSLIPATFFLFSIAKGLQLKSSTTYKKLREVGVLVFFLHMFVKAVIDLGIEAIYYHWGISLSFLSLVLTIFITTLVAIVIEKMSHKEKYLWMRYLYS